MLLNRLVCNTEFPPVTEAASWVKDRAFPADLPLIDVSQAVPGYPTSGPILTHMTEVLQQAPTSKYGHVLGLPELRETYAQHLNAHYTESNSASISADNVAITAGCNQAFYVAVAALCAPGDQVILPTPWYFNHKMSLDMQGIETIALPCDAEQQMIPDAEIANSLITAKTRAIVLVSPNNPTGQIYPPETINAFYALAKKTGIALIIDETYADFRQQPQQAPHRVFTDADWADHAIHLYSFSKAYALAGYRVGALVGSRQLHHEVTKVLDCVSICAPQISQHAALYGLQHEAAWKEQKRTLMYARAAAFREAIEHCSKNYQITAMGAYFAYLQHPFENSDSTTIARSLADTANILTLPGQMFGENQQRYLRIAFANVDQNLMPEIAARLGRHTPA